MSRVTSTYIETVHSSTANRGFLLNAIEYLINGSLDIVAQTKVGSVQSFGRLNSNNPVAAVIVEVFFAAKSTIISYFKRIKYGVLTLECDGVVHEFGEHYVLESDGLPRELKASIKVLDQSFWIRLFMHPDFGFAGLPSQLSLKHDATFSCLLQMFIMNRKNLAEMKTYLAPLIHAISYFCAIFDAEAGGHTGDLKEPGRRPIAPPRNVADPLGREILSDDLERGQMAKLHLVAKKARIRKGSRVLDIGGGWGSFAILAAKEYGAIVDALTISDTQKVAADAIIAAHGLTDQITVHLMDYRDMPPHFESAFDAVISIGVTEHIGSEFLNGWYKKIAWAMKPQDSFKVFTMSTVPDTRWKQFSGEVDFFRKYIYPGAALSSPRTLANAITDAGLNIVSIDDLSPHYTRTSREWGYRFSRNFDSHIKPALKKHDPSITEEGLEIFRRKWTS
ncbi:hypothetical protein C0991_005403 [Blastosporella zonata]|nr:hypothetical protein C0991_005403 [Blastosporella zonata]